MSIPRSNVFDAVDDLPRRTQVAIAAYLLRQTKPSIGELAQAVMVYDNSVRGWLGIRKKDGGTP